MTPYGGVLWVSGAEQIFKMIKDNERSQGSSTAMKQLTPYTQEKKINTSYQLRSKRSVKVS